MLYACVQVAEQRCNEREAEGGGHGWNPGAFVKTLYIDRMRTQADRDKASAPLCALRTPLLLSRCATKGR